MEYFFEILCVLSGRGSCAWSCQDSALRPKAKAKSRSEQNSGETDGGRTSEDVFWRPKWDFD